MVLGRCQIYLKRKHWLPNLTLGSDYQGILPSVSCATCHVFNSELCSSISVLSHNIHGSWITRWFKYYSNFMLRIISTSFIKSQFVNKHLTLCRYYPTITVSIPFWILIFQEITSDPNLQSTANARMYVFAVIRQASPVQLRAGLNGGLCTQWHGQTTTPRATFLAICEKFVGTLTCPANHFREETGSEVYCLSSLSEKTIMSNS